MANALYGINEGQTEQDVAYNLTTLTKDIVVTIDLTKFTTNSAGAKSEILKNLKYIENAILKDVDSIFG